MAELPDNETRTRILDVAEDLFARRGFVSVRLRDIAGAVEMKHASLYYYVPGGKQQLFVEVMERSFRRHHDGLNAAVAQAGDNWREQLEAVVRWLVAKPPVDFVRMIEADMPNLTEQEAGKLMIQAYDAIRLPIVAVLERAEAAGDTQLKDPSLAAMALVSLVQSTHGIPGLHLQRARERLALGLLDMLLNGWLKR